MNRKSRFFNRKQRFFCDRMLSLSRLVAGAEADEMFDAETTSGKAAQSTALMQAAVNTNRQEAVCLLLDHRADPNRTDSNGSNGMTPRMRDTASLCAKAAQRTRRC